MKKIIHKLYISFIASLLIISCKPKFYDAPAPHAASAGTVSLSNYVAIGGTIEAGYADNALYNGSPDGSGSTLADGGQGAAYPNLIASQFKLVNTSLVFNQPNINSKIGWASYTTVNGVAGNFGKKQLAYPFDGTLGHCNSGPVQPQNIQPSDLTSVEAFTGDKATLNNLAVPFIKISQLNTVISSSPPTTNASTNPYKYWLNVVTNASTSNIITEAVNRNPSIFTVWIGYDEFLSVAKSGVVSTLSGVANIDALNALVAGLLANPNTKGAIAKVPYVDQFPIVTNSNRRITSATDPGSYPGTRTLNIHGVDNIVKRLPSTSLAGYNLALSIAGFHTKSGKSPFSTDSTKSQNYVIKKGDGTIAIIKPSFDYIVNSGIIDFQIGTGTQDPNATRSCTPLTVKRQEVGLSSPIPDNAVLDSTEIALLRYEIDQYNAALENIVNQYPDRLVLVDLKNFFLTLTDPLYGIPYGTEIIRTNHPALGPDFGGFFSTDRTYPTPKGQALIANEFIKAINSKWNANVPTLDIDKYRANVIPD